jgi:membrane fusion protein (multidrug efflux system)
MCLLTAIFLAAAAASAPGLAQQQQKKAPPTPVILSKAAIETIFDKIEALGTLRANESVDVTAQVTEIITAIRFEDGQRVKKGDVLAEMTSAEEAALLKEAEATMREAKEQLDRARPLAQQGVSSEATLSERRRTYETAVARYEAVKSRIADRIVLAPFDGIVGLRRISVGALVEPGTVITNIDDDSVMKLDFSIPSTYLPTIKTGAPILATAQAFGNRAFRGKIASIDSRVDPVTRSITVRALIPNPEGALKAGLLMTVEVLKNERQAIVIPEQAVVRRGQETYVFVVDPAAEKPVAEKRVIELGTRTTGTVEVKNGLAAGEHVVTHGTLRVQPGQPVSITGVEDGDQPLSDLLNKKPAGGKSS